MKYRKTTFAEDLRRDSLVSIALSNFSPITDSINDSFDAYEVLPKSKKSAFGTGNSSLFSNILAPTNPTTSRPRSSFIHTKGIKNKILKSFVNSDDFQNDPLNHRFKTLSKQYSKNRTYSYVESLFDDTEIRRASKKLGKHMERQKSFFYGKFLVKSLSEKRSKLENMMKIGKESNQELKNMLSDEIGGGCSGFIAQIIPLYQLIGKLIQEKKNISSLLKSMRTFLNIGSALEFESSMYILFKASKIFSLLRKDLKAVMLLKTCKRIAKLKGNLNFLIKIYKNLGKVYSKLDKHKLAAFYFERLMMTCWLEKNQHFEIQSYEFLSKECYYLGELTKANFYHERYFKGEVEPEDSQLKALYFSYHEMFENQRKEKVKIRGQTKERRVIEGDEMPFIFGISSEEEEFEYQIPWEDSQRLELEKHESSQSSLKMMKAMTPGIWKREANQRIRYNELKLKKEKEIMKKADILSKNKTLRSSRVGSQNKITISHKTSNRTKSAFLSNRNEAFKTFTEIHSEVSPFYNQLDSFSVRKLERCLVNIRMNLVYSMRAADDILKNVKLGLRKKGFISDQNSLELKLRLGGPTKKIIINSLLLNLILIFQIIFHNHEF